MIPVRLQSRLRGVSLDTVSVWSRHASVDTSEWGGRRTSLRVLLVLRLLPVGVLDVVVLLRRTVKLRMVVLPAVGLGAGRLVWAPACQMPLFKATLADGTVRIAVKL